MGKFALPVKRKENEVKEEVKRNWFWKVGGGHLGGEVDGEDGEGERV